MKTAIIRMSIVAVAAACCTVTAEESPRRYPFKSAVVEYKISGAFQKGTETLYIDEHGKKTRKEQKLTISIMGSTTREHMLEIDDGEHHYRIDMKTKTGTKSPSYTKRADTIVSSMNADQKKAMETLGKELLKGLTGSEAPSPVGKETILGKECEIYEVMGTKTWQWKKLMLKMESPMMGSMKQEAVKLEVGADIPPATFTPPKGITFSHARSPKLSRDIPSPDAGESTPKK